jgi:hypothetical protein
MQISAGNEYNRNTDNESTVVSDIYEEVGGGLKIMELSKFGQFEFDVTGSGGAGMTYDWRHYHIGSLIIAEKDKTETDIKNFFSVLWFNFGE